MEIKRSVVLVVVLASCLYGGEPEKEIIRAAEKGKLQLLNELIAQGQDVNVSKRDGWIPLMAAVKNGRYEVVQRLLDKGADTNACKRDGWTPLMEATKKGQLDVSKLLLARGADVNAQTKNGWTALLSAVDESRVDMVELLLETGADVNARKNDGWTALMEASAEGNFEVTKKLLAKGADVNAQVRLESFNNCNMSDGFIFRANKRIRLNWTPLMEAILQGQFKIAGLLLKEGANPNVRVQTENQFIQNNEIVSSKKREGWTPLMEAVDRCQIRTAKLLLDKGADVNAQTSEGDTALTMAQRFHQKNIERLLIRNGAKKMVAKN
jgi:ankyrin repeat protein